MPFTIRILAEDLSQWEYENATTDIMKGKRYHYRAVLEGDLAESIQLTTPDLLDDLVGKDMFCFFNIDKGGWKSRDIGLHPQIIFALHRPAGEIRDPRRLRLRIKSIDESTRPPRVKLEEL